MIENIGKLFSTAAKWAPKPTLGVAIACSLVIFLPETVAARLGIAEFRMEYTGFLGWSFLLAWSYLLAALVWHAKDHIRARLEAKRMQRVRKGSLYELTPEEKGYLAEFMSGRNTILCDVSDGVAGGLLAKGIIYRSSNVFDPIDGVPYNIQPWAKRYLSKHPRLLEGHIERRRRSHLHYI